MEDLAFITPKNKTKHFQIRWNEPLGDLSAPYAYRYVFLFFNYAIRIHVWKCSDAPTAISDAGHYHNRPWYFLLLF